LVDPLKIALGSAQFGSAYGISNKQGSLTDRNVGKIIDYARERGVDTIDTAPHYGDSEARLGRIGVSDFEIISKIPALPDMSSDGKGWVEASIEASLVRLRVEKLHGLLLHNSRDLLGREGEKMYAVIEQYRSAGVVTNLGVSIYDPVELDQLQEQFSLDIIQAPINPFDTRLASSGWLQKLASAEMFIHARSIFLQGLLLMDEKSRPRYFSKWDSIWRKWREYLSTNKVTPLEGCLQHAMSHLPITKHIVGVEEISQLEAVLKVKIQHNCPPFICSESIPPELFNPICWPEA